MLTISWPTHTAMSVRLGLPQKAVPLALMFNVGVEPVS
jgi:hypothetical protein